MAIFKGFFKFLYDTIYDFSDDNATTLAAALAFYSALALAPLLMIFMFIAGLIGPDAQVKLVEQIQELVGPQASSTINVVLDSLRNQHHSGAVSALIGVITLLVSATGVFAQLQFSMNTIWDVHAKPGNDIWIFIRQRLLSLAMMGVVGFLSLVSLALSAALNFIGSMIGGETSFWQGVDFAGSFVVYVLVFALIFKVLPDVRLTWHDVWIGALITALLFVIGKFAIGKYLGYSSVGSAYGAAGSLVVLLLWIYYTSLIVFLGAEITQHQARRYDRGMTPKAHGEMDISIKGRKMPSATVPQEGGD